MPQRILAIALLSALPPAAWSETAAACSLGGIDRASYRLTTEVQALIATRAPVDWRSYFDPVRLQETTSGIAVSAMRAAERALEIDPRNIMGHSLLAREFLILENAQGAEREMRQVMEADAAVVWTATLYDVDVKSYFVMAFNRRSIRIYRFGQLVSPLRTHPGLPVFPGPEAVGFWEASGGCPDSHVAAEAEIPWSDVREIKAGNWVLWFKLARPVTVSSDRGKRHKLDEIKVNLHGATGTTETYTPPGEDEPSFRSRGPAGFQDLVRRTLVLFVDPERRIALPPSKPGLGW